jgi:hypothetical protein
LHFCYPPADSNEEKSPIFEKLWRLAFKGVTDELKCPSSDEQGRGWLRCATIFYCGRSGGQRQKNQRNAYGVAGSIHGMLVTGGVLRDPFFAGTVS